MTLNDRMLPVFFLKRTLAAIIDYALFFGFFYTYLFLVGTSDNNGVYHIHSFLHILTIIFVWFIYFPGLEALLGYTLGKGLLDLKVIDEKGNKALFFQTCKRRLCDIIDFAFFGVVGLIAINYTEKRERISDRWANTFVVSESFIKEGFPLDNAIAKSPKYDILKFFKEVAPLLKTISLIFGLYFSVSLFIEIGFLPIRYMFTVYIPGMENINPNDRTIIVYYFIGIINVALMLGGLSIIKKIDYLKFFLVLAWGMLTFGIQTNFFIWIPIFNESNAIDFGFIFIMSFTFYLNLIPLFFLLWSIIATQSQRQNGTI